MSPIPNHSRSIKVPKVDLYFWIIKLLTTAMGEAASDYLVHQINPYLAVGFGFIGFCIAMVLQLSARKFIAWIYWFNAAMVALFGTMVADVMHIVLGIPYLLSAIIFGSILAVLFVWWYKSEGTLSIHSVYNLRRELFYWSAIIATFALGTAVGDLTAYTLNFGFLASGIIFLIVFAMPGLARQLFKINQIFAFWFAYIITRPLGASFADWSAKPKFVGGLGLGDGPVTLTLTVLIVILVGYVSLQG